MNNPVLIVFIVMGKSIRIKFELLFFKMLERNLGHRGKDLNMTYFNHFLYYIICFGVLKEKFLVCAQTYV